MGILRSILMKGMNGEVRRALFVRAKTPTIFGLGFFANAVLTLNSDEAKEKQSMAELKSDLESIKACMKSLEERQNEIDKSVDDLKRRQQQLIEEIIGSGVSLDEMDEKKLDDLVQTEENEGGIWNV